MWGTAETGENHNRYEHLSYIMFSRGKYTLGINCITIAARLCSVIVLLLHVRKLR